jgi:hypothetical protein
VFPGHSHETILPSAVPPPFPSDYPERTDAEQQEGGWFGDGGCEEAMGYVAGSVAVNSHDPAQIVDPKYLGADRAWYIDPH